MSKILSQQPVSAQNLRKNGLKNARLFKECKRCGPGVALSNVAFSRWRAKKVNAYMNFSAPEKIFIFNLWPQLGQQFKFNRAMCRKFYHSKHFVHETREKNDLKNARPSTEFYFAPAAFRSCGEQRSLFERRKRKKRNAI